MSEPTDVFDSVWNMYVEPLKPRMRTRASDIAKEDDRQDVIAADVFNALREFIPGKPLPSAATSEHEELQRQGWFNKNVTGFIGITGGLAIVFGILGLVPFAMKTEQNQAYAQVATGFLEIAKLCAGALVGGAAGAAAASTTKKIG